MAEWTEIPAATFDIDRPVLGSTHLAIVQNFEAMGEGAVGAPRVTSEALTGIRQSRLQATGSSFVTITGLARYRSIHLICAFIPNTDDETRNIEVQLSTDNGSSWTTARTVASFSQAGFVRYEGFFVNIGLQDGVIISNSPRASGMDGYFNEGAASYNAVRIRQSSVDIVGNILQVVPYLWEDKT